jgi:hypothetical protein
MLESSEREMVTVDGKSLPSSSDRHLHKTAIYMVMTLLFAIAQRVGMGQVKTSAQWGKIITSGALSRLLHIKRCVINFDIIGFQHKIKTLVDKKIDYLIALKATRKRVHDGIHHTLLSAYKITTGYIDKVYTLVEVSKYNVLAAGNVVKAYPDWAGLKTIAIAIKDPDNDKNNYLNAG